MGRYGEMLNKMMQADSEGFDIARESYFSRINNQPEGDEGDDGIMVDVDGEKVPKYVDGQLNPEAYINTTLLGSVNEINERGLDEPDWTLDQPGRFAAVYTALNHGEGVSDAAKRLISNVNLNYTQKVKKHLGPNLRYGIDEQTGSLETVDVPKEPYFNHRFEKQPGKPGQENYKPLYLEIEPGKGKAAKRYKNEEAFQKSKKEYDKEKEEAEERYKAELEDYRRRIDPARIQYKFNNNVH